MKNTWGAIQQITMKSNPCAMFITHYFCKWLKGKSTRMNQWDNCEARREVDNGSRSPFVWRISNSNNPLRIITHTVSTTNLSKEEKSSDMANLFHYWMKILTGIWDFTVNLRQTSLHLLPSQTLRSAVKKLSKSECWSTDYLSFCEKRYMSPDLPFKHSLSHHSPELFSNSKILAAFNPICLFFVLRPFYFSSLRPLPISLRV
jgi:hypothetical protein